MSILQQTYFQTNPLSDIAQAYGLDHESDVIANTHGDHYVSYGQTRRFRFGRVVIVLYRMDSGSYEATHYLAA